MILDILSYPDPRLRQPARPVRQFDDGLRQLAEDMLETMYDAGGMGLAAPQVNRSLRLVVMDLDDEKTCPEVFVNPGYSVLDEQDREGIQEGCLSVPSLRVEVQRFSRIAFEYRTLEGELKQEKPEGIRAICLQHELDHLDGRLLVDYLSRMQLHRYRQLLKKQQKQQQLMTAARAPGAIKKPEGPRPLVAAVRS